MITWSRFVEASSDPRYEARRTRASLNLQFDDGDVDHEAFADLEDDDDDDSGLFYLYLSRKLFPTVGRGFSC